jgi:hypothetical protein
MKRYTEYELNDQPAIKKANITENYDIQSILPEIWYAHIFNNNFILTKVYIKAYPSDVGEKKMLVSPIFQLYYVNKYFNDLIKKYSGDNTMCLCVTHIYETILYDYHDNTIIKDEIVDSTKTVENEYSSLYIKQEWKMHILKMMLYKKESYTNLHFMVSYDDESRIQNLETHDTIVTYCKQNIPEMIRALVYFLITPFCIDENTIQIKLHTFEYLEKTLQHPDWFIRGLLSCCPEISLMIAIIHNREDYLPEYTINKGQYICLDIITKYLATAQKICGKLNRDDLIKLCGIRNMHSNFYNSKIRTDMELTDVYNMTRCHTDVKSEIKRKRHKKNYDKYLTFLSTHMENPSFTNILIIIATNIERDNIFPKTINNISALALALRILLLYTDYNIETLWFYANSTQRSNILLNICDIQNTECMIKYVLDIYDIIDNLEEIIIKVAEKNPNFINELIDYKYKNDIPLIKVFKKISKYCPITVSTNTKNIWFGNILDKIQNCVLIKTLVYDLVKNNMGGEIIRPDYIHHIVQYIFGNRNLSTCNNFYFEKQIIWLRNLIGPNINMTRKLYDKLDKYPHFMQLTKNTFAINIY